MTAEEKAKELYLKCFESIPVPDYDEYESPLETHIARAKRCAIIAVDEIISEYAGAANVNMLYRSDRAVYWQEVKSNITA